MNETHCGKNECDFKVDDSKIDEIRKGWHMRR